MSDYPIEATRTIIGKGGRIVIPAAMRKKMGVKEGDEVRLLMSDDGGMRIMSAKIAFNNLQKLVQKYIPKEAKLSEELIASRKEELNKEEAKFGRIFSRKRQRPK